MPPKKRNRNHLMSSEAPTEELVRRRSANQDLHDVAILELGLMGTSLGMALRATNRVVIGYDEAPGVAERAREMWLQVKSKLVSENGLSSNWLWNH